MHINPITQAQPAAAAHAAVTARVSPSQVSGALLQRAQNDGDGKTGAAALNDGDGAAQAAAQAVKAAHSVDVKA